MPHWRMKLDSAEKNSDLPTIEARYSAKKLLRVLWIGVVFTALCTFIAFGHLTNPAPGIIVLIAAYCGIFIFGFGALRLLFQFITRSGRVAITVNADGIRDVRVAAEAIPWAAISDVSPFAVPKPSLWPFGKREYNVSGLFLTLLPECEAGLAISWGARASRVANRVIGMNGIYINGAGLEIDWDEFLKVSKAYLNAVRTRPKREEAVVGPR